MRLTLLGTGTSIGVPQIGCGCAVCRSDDPRDRRTRTAALIESRRDAPPDRHAARAAVAAACGRHRPARRRALHARTRRSRPRHRRPPLLLAAPACSRCRSMPRRRRAAHLRRAFHYIFDAAVVPAGRHLEAAADARADRAPARPVAIAGVEVRPIAFEHGHADGLRLPDRSGGLRHRREARARRRPATLLRGVRVLVLNALWWREHPTHLSIDEAIEVAQDIGAERTLPDPPHPRDQPRRAARALPPGIEPGYDGHALRSDADAAMSVRARDDPASITSMIIPRPRLARASHASTLP